MRGVSGPPLGWLTVNPTVVALLVSHDGSRWLPAVVEGLRSQTVPLAGVVCVDTGSHDDSPDLLLDAFDEVVTVSGRTAYPEAVRIGLAQVPAEAAEWVWLLHDDSNPAPDALERLLAAAAADPAGRRARPQAARVALAQAPARGRDHDLRHRPARDRPRGRRVRPGPARRGPPGARGQHGRHAGPARGLRPTRRPRRQPADVRQRPRLRLARGHGGSADRRGPGRRRLPCRGGTPRPPAYAAHRSPHPLSRAPGGPVHPAGERPGPGSALAGRAPLLRHPAADDRVPGRPLGRGGPRRARGPLLRRTPAPGRSVAPARPARRSATARPAPLLAPWWVPYRHGLDFVGDIAAAATNQAQDVADRRRAAKEAEAPGAAASPGRRTRRRGRGGRGHRPGRALLHQPAGRRAQRRRGALDRRRPRGVRSRHRWRPGPRRRPTRRHLWTLWIEPVAPARHGHRGPRPGVRRADGGARLGARQQRCRRGLGRAAARRTAGPVGRLAAAPRGRPSGRPGRLAPLAGRARRGHLCPRAGHLRRLGRRPARRGGGRRSWCPGSRTPPSASPTPSRTAAGAPAWRTGLLLAMRRGLRAGRLGLRRAC